MPEFRLRYLEVPIREDLSSKMIFIGGPRQVGKTTLAQKIAGDFSSTAYFNWDNRSHRQAILREQWPPETELLIIDELHKFPRWKTFVKGVWDTRRYSERIIVTGSSRLDVYCQRGFTNGAVSLLPSSPFHGPGTGEPGCSGHHEQQSARPAVRRKS